MTPVYREVTYNCQNGECEYLFVASISPVRTITASRRPNAEVSIPTSHYKQQSTAA